MWRRGLKQRLHPTPHRRVVASHVEAWIETSGIPPISMVSESPPMWRRGLKLGKAVMLNPHFVASHVEAWIETASARQKSSTSSGRLPCGGVD